MQRQAWSRPRGGLRPGGAWSLRPSCQQWAAFDVLGVCPSFRWTGTLAADPDARLAEHHYRRRYRVEGEGPVPLVAREHTARLSPQLATDFPLNEEDCTP